MPDGYGSHADYMSWVSDDATTRHAQVEAALREAFAPFVESRPTDVIVFSSVSAADLATAIQSHPLVLKPLAAACNIAARAIERDLGIKNVDTYKPRLTPQQAGTIAGYLKPFLPPYMEIPALSHLDRTAFIDKEIRKAKGNWEEGVTAALNGFSSVSFKKRKFHCGLRGVRA